jgi:transposase
MSMHPSPIEPVPEETARIARAAFRKGNLLMRIRDEIGILYDDQMFASLYDARGQLAISPWRLALVTVFQFLENLSDRQAAEAVRGRIDLKYALSLDLEDAGFDFSVLCEFRARLLAGGRDQSLLEVMLERLRERGLVKARGKQRTDSTHVLAAIPHPQPPGTGRRDAAGRAQRRGPIGARVVGPAEPAGLGGALWRAGRAVPPAQRRGRPPGSGRGDRRRWP